MIAAQARTLGPLPRRTPNMAATLVVLAGPRRGTAFDLATDEALVGRGEGCAVGLSSESASKRHAAIRRQGPRFTVEDLGSRNGTQVRGTALAPGQVHPLRHGDTIEMGDETLLFCDAGRQASLEHLRFDAAKVQAEVDALLLGIV